MPMPPYQPTYYDRMLGKTYSEMMADMGWVSPQQVDGLRKLITAVDDAETAELTLNKITGVNYNYELYKQVESDYMASYYAQTLQNGSRVGGNLVTEVTSSADSVLSTSTKTGKIASAVDVGTYTAEGTEYATMKGVGKAATGTAAKGSSTLGSYVFGEVLPFLGAVATGAQVGLAIDEAVYQAHPDWWWYNVENWDNILLGHDSMLPILHDGSRGQSYMSEEAILAYMQAYYNLGAFNSTGSWSIPENPVLWEAPDQTMIQLLASYAVTGPCTISYSYWNSERTIKHSYSFQIHGNCLFYRSGENTMGCVVLEGTTPKTTGYSYTEHYVEIRNGSVYSDTTTEHQWGNNHVSSSGASGYWSSGPTIYIGGSIFYDLQYSCPVTSRLTSTRFLNNTIIFAINGNPNIAQQEQAVPGITTVGTLPSDYTSIANSYPNWWGNRITTNGTNPDGSNKTVNWLPVPMPMTVDLQEEMQKIINKVKSGELSVFDPEAQIDVGSDGEIQSDTGEQTDDDTAAKVMGSTAMQAIINMLSDVRAKIADATSTNPGSSIPTVTPQPNPTNTSGQGDTDPPVVPAGSISNGMCMVYNPTRSELVSLSRFLWSTSFIDLVQKLFASPMDGIIGIHELYVTPSVGGRANIVCGYVDSGVESNYVDERYATIDCGEVSVKEMFGNIFDYSYTDLELFLPFVGFVQLDIGEVMRGTLKVQYTVDVLTGATLARVSVMRDNYEAHVYSFGGNCAAQVPYSSGTNSMIFSAICGAVAGGVSGGIGGAIIGATKETILHGKKTVEKGGGWGPNINSMDDKKPFLLLKSNMSSMPTNYNEFQGYPLHQTAAIGSCKYFTRVTNIHYSGPATQTEIDEIEEILSEGAIL